MKYRIHKSQRIANELITYCYNNGAKEIDVNFILENSFTIIKIVDKSSKMNEKNVKELSDNLNIPRHLGMEESYWKLSVSTEVDDENQLPLIGMMIDSAIIEIVDKDFIMILKRSEIS